MEISGKKITFLGDSITAGANASSRDKNFVSQIAALYGANVCNLGIGGSRIARQKSKSENPKYDMDFCSRIDEIDADSDIIVIFGGTNDYGHGDAPIGSFSDRDVYTFYGALHYLYSNILERFPNAATVVVTPLHRINEFNVLGEGYKSIPSGTLLDYVNVIREVAEYYSIPIIDLYAESGYQPEIKANYKKYCTDGLHPNDAGHLLIAHKIAKFLLQI